MSTDQSRGGARCFVTFQPVLLTQSGQIRQMEEVKISKKSKVGILPFVVGFEEFAELAETIFRNAERRGDLDKAYVKLIRAVFMNGKHTGNLKYKKLM